MNRKVLSLIIFSLLLINAFVLIRYNQLKKQYVSVLYKRNISESSELHAYQVNFISNIENSNIKIRDVMIKDSLDEIYPLETLLKRKEKPLLVCRFSEYYCESCVSSAIKIFRHWSDSIGEENVLLLGAYRNNKILNKTKPLYDIHHLNVVNAHNLNIPAEDLGYPYFFMLDNDLTVSDVFIPDKILPKITNNYLDMIANRYYLNQ